MNDINKTNNSNNSNYSNNFNNSNNLSNINITDDAIKDIISNLTLEEKASLCSGLDCWNTKPVERLGIPSIMVSDGPHGLRKQCDSQDNLGIGNSVPATCFPTASLSACSFNRDLIYKMGTAIAEECIDNNVQVLLGPGINIKRNPLCGRNFEYYSEDPLVAAEMGKAFVNGVQSKGVGTSLKHFAVNNQERRRMNVSAEIDERTLREIYLKAFEYVIKDSRPYTVMCSYNRINGLYSSENYYLLTDILRNEWGYDGLVVSDWGAVCDRVKGVDAGLDLEMPGSLGANDKKIINAVKSLSLSENALNDSAKNVLNLVNKCNNHTYNKSVSDSNYDSYLKLNLESDSNSMIDSQSINHHELAVTIAEESMVLLKNNNSLLPLKNPKKITVIGALAKNCRFQGAGSSKINPIKLDIPYDEICREFNLRDDSISYYEGYSIDSGKKSSNDDILLNEALEAAKSSDTVIIFAGLTERYESEGFDRSDMSMPLNQNKLINAIAKVNDKVIVVLVGGAPIDIPWADDVNAILLAYLGGEGAATAISHILSGKVNPSGKLAETWPYSANDCLSSKYFPGDRLTVQYREGLFVGYRYFNTVCKAVRYPFGYGLSYSNVNYLNLKLSDGFNSIITLSNTEDLEKYINFSVEIQNTSEIDCKETILLFAEKINRRVVGSKYNLIGFEKCNLNANGKGKLNISVKLKDLGYYDAVLNRFNIESGEYIIHAGKNINNLILKLSIEIINNIQVDNIKTELRKFDNYLTYFNNQENYTYTQISNGNDTSSIPIDDFESILNHKSTPAAPLPARPFNMDNCLEDTTVTFTGRLIFNIASKIMKKMSDAEEGQDQMMLAAIKEMPFHALWSSSDGMISEEAMYGILTILNGHLFKGLHQIFKNRRIKSN